MKRTSLRRLRDLCEWLLLKALFAFFRAIGIQKSSDMMGALARWVGPKLRSKNRIARTNLRHAFPEWSDERVEKTILGMWDNMGRYLGEFPHIAHMSKDDFRAIVEVHGEEHLKAAAESEHGTLFFSAHMGNWELGAKTAWVCDAPCSIVYRPLNNPHVDALANWHRNHYQVRGLPKNSRGSRELVKNLRNGERVAILIDQKMNTGIPVPFFGRDAMTATAIADLTIRYGYPIMPTQVERLDNTCRFRVTLHPPVKWESTGDAKADAKKIMRLLHSHMETWITQHPEQWFWLHKRWG